VKQADLLIEKILLVERDYSSGMKAQGWHATEKLELGISSPFRVH
jgi:hypothetical protein